MSAPVGSQIAIYAKKINENDLFKLRGLSNTVVGSYCPFVTSIVWEKVELGVKKSPSLRIIEVKDSVFVSFLFSIEESNLRGCLLLLSMQRDVLET